LEKKGGRSSCSKEKREPFLYTAALGGKDGTRPEIKTRSEERGLGEGGREEVVGRHHRGKTPTRPFTTRGGKERESLGETEFPLARKKGWDRESIGRRNETFHALFHVRRPPGKTGRVIFQAEIFVLFSYHKKGGITVLYREGETPSVGVLRLPRDKKEDAVVSLSKKKKEKASVFGTKVLKWALPSDSQKNPPWASKLSKTEREVVFLNLHAEKRKTAS